MSTKAIDSVTYWSLAEYAEAAEKYASAKIRNDSRYDWTGKTDWTGALKMARMGWTEQLESTLELAQSAVETADREHMMDSFNQPVWDVTGSQVDIGAFLAGTPECMIDYPLTETSKVGRVITLCASVCYSGSIGSETINRRGRVIVALALALSRLGHNVELWADISSENIKGETLHMRILVKGADGELDAARIMFAYAHPAMLRRVGFGAKNKFGKKYHPASCIPVGPAKDLPEGTIYLPEICSDEDVPNAEEFLREHLGELGLLAE